MPADSAPGSSASGGRKRRSGPLVAGATMTSVAVLPPLQFDHVGYAVAEIEAYLREFVEPVLRPIAVSTPIEDPLQGVRVAFVSLRGGVRLELVEPLSDSSPVSNLLKRRRGGLYHLCYSTPDLPLSLAGMATHGCRRISGPTPAAAFGGRHVAFVFTPQSDLLELVDERHPSDTP